MFIFDRSFAPVAAGLGTAFLFVCLDRLSQPPGESPKAISQPLQTPGLADHAIPGVSELVALGDSSSSCASPAASARPLARSNRIALEQLPRWRLERSAEPLGHTILRQEPVFDSKQCGSRARGYPDFSVEVLNVVAGGLLGDTQRLGNLTR
jgi:hypothetical protein